MNTATRSSDFFVAGGTLHPDSPSYVKRTADDELFNLALSGELCYVLTSRQMGKSSLMVRTHRRLQEQGISTAIIDLTEIGLADVEQWYLVLVSLLGEQLRLSVDPAKWWQERASLSVAHRFIRFLRDVVLTEITGPIVIFVDEIDTTLKLGFSDDFFTAIRFTYNAYATDPVFSRLTFILLGAATPADLIKDSARTPFNVGREINLSEFNREEARVLQKGLEAMCPGQGRAILDRLFYWTGGHPYLTQKLCLAVVQGGEWTDTRIDRLVERLFLSEEARKESNLQFVRKSMQDSLERSRLLTLYRQVYEGKEVQEDDRSLDQNRLKLFGLVRGERGRLKVRNEIYRRVFNLDWIKANTPVDWTWRIAIIAITLALLLVSVLGFVIYRQSQQTIQTQAQTHIANFNINNREVRLTSLAGLFQLPGYADEARRLFLQGLSPADQLALFDLPDPQGVSEQLVTVVRGLYTDLEDNKPEDDLLKAMLRPLEKLDNPAATNLKGEIKQWLLGRSYYAQGNHKQARDAYNSAIELNETNPCTRFERAQVYAVLGQYREALADFDYTVQLAETQASDVRNIITSDKILYQVWAGQMDDYPSLLVFVPTPTPTHTPSPTATPTSTPTPSPSALPTPTNVATPAPVTGSEQWSPVEPLLIPRARHGAVLLRDGRILIAGGVIEGGPSTNSVEIYDPAGGRYSQIASLNFERHDPSATLLPDGRVLVVGGYSTQRGWLTDAEIYDPAANEWQLVPPLFAHGHSHTATLLQDGQVLITGGSIGPGPPGTQFRAEIFDPATNSWRATTPLTQGRVGHSATLLLDGRVLVVGGNEGSRMVASVEIYDPTQENWIPTGSLTTERAYHSGVLLQEGQVMVAGGSSAEQDSGILNSAEMYDPTKGIWNTTPPLAQGSYAHEVLRLLDGRVMLIGGSTTWQPYHTSNRVEVYDPISHTWEKVASLANARSHHKAILLPDGRVFVAGGYTIDSVSGVNSTEIFQSSYQADVVLLMHFEEFAGSKVFSDSSDHTNYGSCSGQSCPRAGEEGISGSALFFDGVDDKIIIPASSSLNVQEQFTLEAWFNPYDYSLQRPIIEWSNGREAGVHMWVKTWGGQWGGKGTGANLVDTTGNDSAYVISIPDPSLNQWHHLVVTYNRASGVAHLYLDGKLEKEEPLGSFIPQTSYDVYIGKRPTQNDAQFYGLIDEVAIYNRVLTAVEVLAHYREGQE